jgi:hypothetical protein
VERDKPKQSESVGQTLPQLPWKQKGGFKIILDSLVTCYDHFCVFQFFSILAVSMATAAILKKSTLTSTTSHGI